MTTWTWVDERSFPASWTRMRTWSSPATARPSLPPGCPDSPMPPEESVRRSLPPAPPRSRCCGPTLRDWPPHSKYVDVFCEQGAFDGDETRHILNAGLEAGLIPRVHANQLSEGPGVQLAVELGAASADHCTLLSDTDIDALAGSSTVATLLP